MREVERNPSGRPRPHQPGDEAEDDTVDTKLLVALGHLHEDDCRILELRLGLDGGPGLAPDDAAAVLGLDPAVAEEREEKALAKLRHPSTPGDLTHVRRINPRQG